jgi:hypothetical protein
LSNTTKTNKKHWSRAETAEKVNKYEQEYQRTPSQRQLAKDLGVPRTTLQHWLKRKGSIDADPAVVAFFESPTGVAFLHRLVVAAHFVMTLVGPCGIRLVCLFLELTSLDQFVAASYGPHQKVSVAMQDAVIAFGQEERERLAENMSHKQITVCEDETFHPQVCLVAIEPVSNFILLERYADNRKAKTWTKMMKEVTADLSVEIIQSTSDEGRGLIHHVRDDLGVQHSPDVFHVQHELVKGTSLVLAHKKRQAGNAVAELAQKLNRYQEKKKKYLDDKNGSKRLAKLEQKIEQTQVQESETRESLETATEHQERAQKAIQGISATYHPYDLETGAARSAEQVSATLELHFTELETVAMAANLSQSCLDRIQKAKRVVVDMIATISFFSLTVQAKVEALSLSPQVEQAVYDNLIPAIYLRLVSERTQDPEQRCALEHSSEKLATPLLKSNGPFAGFDEKEKAVIETVAHECAQLFQRSSSCVEGRNGQLALRHHCLHRISDRKLAALTTVHNYFIKRSDGTTAAERFFGAKPRDLFEYILDQVDLPGRPAQRRSHPKRKVYLPHAAV